MVIDWYIKMSKSELNSLLFTDILIFSTIELTGGDEKKEGGNDEEDPEVK